MPSNADALKIVPWLDGDESAQEYVRVHGMLSSLKFMSIEVSNILCLTAFSMCLISIASFHSPRPICLYPFTSFHWPPFISLNLFASIHVPHFFCLTVSHFFCLISFASFLLNHFIFPISFASCLLPHFICLISFARRCLAGIQQGAESEQGRIVPRNFYPRQRERFDQRHSGARKTSGSVAFTLEFALVKMRCHFQEVTLH